MAHSEPDFNVENEKSFRPRTQKRVRFLEPVSSSHSSGKNAALMRVIYPQSEHHVPARISKDVSVFTTSPSGLNQDNWRIILDELQYLLDGVFHNIHSAKSKQGSFDIVLSSLYSLVYLLLSDCNNNTDRTKARIMDDMVFRGDTSSLSTDGSQSVMMELLVSQPSLVSNIVKRFTEILGIRTTIDALVALVLTMIFRSAGSSLLITECELDLLLNNYLRSCVLCLKTDMVPTKYAKVSEREGTRNHEETSLRNFSEGVGHRKGTAPSVDTLNQLVRDAGVVDHDSSFYEDTPFRFHTDGATYLLGAALSTLLGSVPEVSFWMRVNRRLDRLVAVIYCCETIVKKQIQQTGADDRVHFSRSWNISVGGALKMMEFVSLDSVCSAQILSETKVTEVVLDILHWSGISKVATGSDSEWVICSSLRICINLLQKHQSGFSIYSDRALQVVLDRLVQECVASKLIETSLAENMENKENQISVPSSTSNRGGNENSIEMGRILMNGASFDVRVLCLFLLVHMVDRYPNLRESFPLLQCQGLTNQCTGALTVITEILRKGIGDKDPVFIEPGEAVTNREGVNDSERFMEQEITTGYVCLLIGALVRDCDPNRMFLESNLPQHGLHRVGKILREFLDFHHEVGVVSALMDNLYEKIISSLLVDANTTKCVNGTPSEKAVASTGELKSSESNSTVTDVEMQEVEHIAMITS